MSCRGFDVPVRLEGHKLAAVWASVRRHQVSGTTLAARHCEELGLPRVSDCEAERQDNRARSARRHRAAAHARRAARAALGTPDATATATQGAAPLEPAGLLAARLGTFQARPLTGPMPAVRLGGSRRPFSPCQRCLHCECQQNRDLSAAQPPTPRRSPFSCRRSTSPNRPPTPRRPHTRSPKRDSSPGPPQLSREEPDTKDDPMSWADAQASFSQGASSQGYESPVLFMDAATCDGLIQDLRGDDGQLPDFNSIGSEPGSPPPALEAEVAHGNKKTQTSPMSVHDHSTDALAPVATSDAATQVISRLHQGTSSTQTPLRPPRQTKGSRCCYGHHVQWPIPRRSGLQQATRPRGLRPTGQGQCPQALACLRYFRCQPAARRAPFSIMR